MHQARLRAGCMQLKRAPRWRHRGHGAVSMYHIRQAPKRMRCTSKAAKEVKPVPLRMARAHMPLPSEQRHVPRPATGRVTARRPPSERHHLREAPPAAGQSRQHPRPPCALVQASSLTPSSLRMGHGNDAFAAPCGGRQWQQGLAAMRLGALVRSLGALRPGDACNACNDGTSTVTVDNICQARAPPTLHAALAGTTTQWRAEGHLAPLVG